MQRALAELNAELEAQLGRHASQNRTGVNTGEVVAGDPSADQRLITGDAVNVAARLEQAARPSEVLLGELTYRLVPTTVSVEPVEPLELKGKAEPVPAYRLIAVLQDAGVARRRPRTRRWSAARRARPAAGAFDEAVGDRRPRLVTVLGQAGVGKSRLAAEFAARTVEASPSAQRAAACRTARASPSGRWPRSIRDAAASRRPTRPRRAGEDRALLRRRRGRRLVDCEATASGCPTPPFPIEEMFWGVRRLLETLAARPAAGPGVDDIHWAEPTFLDLIEHLRGAARPGPC